MRCASQADQFFDLRLLSESGDLKIGAMHAQQQPGFFVDRFFVVADAGSIGCSHLAQDGIRFRHDIRNAEGAADLDQLSPGNDDFAVFRQSVEREEDCSGVVVHYDGGDSLAWLTRAGTPAST